jgi:arabinofuranan 3-O-arabinosyltransferase
MGTVTMLAREALFDPGSEAATQPPTDAVVPHESRRLSRWALLIAFAAALGLCLGQEPGVIVDDTKLPLIMSPLAFMQNALHLWNPQQYSGSVQALSYGYLFPMGPFFALTHALHISVWVAERIWLASLLTIAFWGVVRLAEALRIGGRGGRVLAGIAYTIAPITVTWAATSAALLVVAFLPWVLVPLVHGSRGGSPRRAAAASGVAVALMGGVNVAGVAAALPVAVIYLMTRQRGPRRRALAGWWVLAVVLACFWWITALAIQSRYGYNYLPYTETPGITTGTASLFEAVRGASYWIDYFTLGGPLLPGAHELVSLVVPILGTSVVAALGLAGLARRRVPERLFLVSTLSLGVVAIAIGYAGALSGPLSGAAQSALGGVLAPLRNVGKFSPDVALPLALGLGWFVSSVHWRPALDLGRLNSAARPLGKQLAATVAVVALVGASMPFWQLKLYPPGGFARIPGYWDATAKWLNGHQGHQTALLVPGAAFGEYTWGRPLDDPLSVLLDRSWTVRSLIPLGSDGNDQVLDAVESSLDSGVVVTGLAQYLSRAGIEYVVERNDLELGPTGAPPPAQVHQVLSEAPGLRRVASFGPLVPLSQLATSQLPIYDGSLATLRLHQVEIYRVTPPGQAVTTYPARDPVILSGSPSSLSSLTENGGVTGRATVLASDPDVPTSVTHAPSATWADTDGNQRRDVSFGAIRQNVSYVLGPGQRTSAATRHVPENYAVVPGVDHETVAAPVGAAAVSASSYGSTTLVRDPAEGPAAAFDTDRSTAWVASYRNSSIEQWVQIDFGHSRALSSITVTPLYDGSQRPTVRQLTITTERGTVTRAVAPKEAPTTVTTPSGPTRWLRLTISGVVPAAKSLRPALPEGAGLTSVAIPGGHFINALQLPADEASAFAHPSSGEPVYSFSSPLDNENLTLGAHSDEQPQMARWFTVPKPTAVTITGTATPVADSALNSLVPAPTSDVRIAANTWLGDLPRFSPQNLLGSSGRPWISGYGDFKPTLAVSWQGQRSIGSLVLQPEPSASEPRQLVLVSPAGKRVVNVPPGGGTVTFKPMVTDLLFIRFSKVQAPANASLFPMPVGLDRLSIPALGSIATTRPPASTPFSLPCGKGPALVLDGHLVPTSLSGTLGDLEGLKPLPLTVCAPNGLQLSSGRHLLVGSGEPDAFKITSVVATPVSVPQPSAARAARIVGTWGPQTRTVHVGAGPATLLAVSQNYNRGWKATLGGQTLEPVRIDGWQQGWLVPRGAAGTVTMTFTPDRAYRLGLLVGGMLLLGLLVLLAVPGRRATRQPPVGQRRPLPRWALTVAAAVVLAVLVGPLALLLLPVWLIGRRWGLTALAAIAGLAFVAAGVAVAIAHGGQPAAGTGSASPFAQAATALSLAAVLAAMALRGRTSRPAPRRGPGSPGVGEEAVEGTGTDKTMTPPDRSAPSTPTRPRATRRDTLAGTPWGAPIASLPESPLPPPP